MSRVLRGGLLGLLAGLLLLGLPWPPGDVRVLEAPGDGLPPVEEPPPARVLWTGEAPPAPEAWRALTVLAGERPLTAAVPGAAPELAWEVPSRLEVGRAATLALELRGEPGAERLVRVRAPVGAEDSLPVRLDAAGRARTHALLRPTRSGWGTWEVLVGGDTAGVRHPLWVEEGRPRRVLALSGPPGSELPLALRALEEAGEEVTAWIHLGRDVWVGREAGALPVEPGAWAEWDVVVLFPGVPFSAGAAEALREAVEGRGLGLLLAAADGGRAFLPALGLGEGWAVTRPAAADTLRWRTPPGVPALPPATLEPLVRSFEGPGDPLLRLVAPGRGRAGALGVAETWRWRLEAGEGDQHRAFWAGLVGWLAEGLRDDPAVEVEAGDARVGDRVGVVWIAGPDLDPPPAPLLGVEASEGGPPSLLGLPSPRLLPYGWVAWGAFVPLEPGGYRIRPLDGDGEPLGRGAWLHVQRAEEDGPDPGGRLARLALASPGGEVLPPAVAAERARDARAGMRWRGAALPLLFLLAAGLASAEWGLRRLSGRP